MAGHLLRPEALIVASCSPTVGSKPVNSMAGMSTMWCYGAYALHSGSACPVAVPLLLVGNKPKDSLTKWVSGVLLTPLHYNSPFGLASRCVSHARAVRLCLCPCLGFGWCAGLDLMGGGRT